MFNRILGKKPEGSDAAAAPSAPPAAGSEDAVMADAPSASAPAAGSDDAPAAAPLAAAPPAADLNKALSALTHEGKSWAVRVSVSNRDVSPPGSDVEDEGMEREGFETATSEEPGLKPPADQPMEESNVSTNGSEDDAPDGRASPHPPRRGRSASMDGAEGEEGGLSRGESSSSDAPVGGGGDAAASEGGSNFEASLLLGIASNLPPTPQPEKEKREPIDPTTLPTSMTSFLDMLTEDQRRVRHRHIPGVDGFRKLYKSEVKADMSEARRMKKASKLKERDDMDIDEIEEDAKSVSDKEDEAGHNREAFVVPDKELIDLAIGGQLPSLLEGTDFEHAMRSTTSSSQGTTSLKSPRLVDSLTSFNPPRPQESTAAKTSHRLKRWEANPSDVETDLLNYKKTVARTREELHGARDEHVRVESIAALVRNHFMEHLQGYREETVAMNEELQSLNSKCQKLDEEYNGLRMSTRGGGSSRSMKDILGTLKSLGEEIKGVPSSASAGGGDDKDWRTAGFGGVSAKDPKKGEKRHVASGWLLEGDEVIVTATGEEGKVVDVGGPKLEKSDESSKDTEAKKKDKDAMDVDPPNKEKDAKKDDKDSSSKKVTPPTIVVALASGQKKSFSPTELELNAKKVPSLASLSDGKVGGRWMKMASDGANNGVNHDVLAMEEYISKALAKARKEEEEAKAAEEEAKKSDDGREDGGKSPKSVVQYDDERSVLPFGSGFMAAPEDVRNYPSVIPLDNLEENVRSCVYEVDKPRVMPVMPPDVRPHEARAEEINALKGKVLQLRNRLGRQKRLRSLNERSLAAGKGRAHKVEGLLLEMQMDLKNLKERLQDELNEIGIGDSPLPTSSAAENGEDERGGDEVMDDPEEESAPVAPKPAEEKPADADNAPADVATGDASADKPANESKEGAVEAAPAGGAVGETKISSESKDVAATESAEKPPVAGPPTGGDSGAAVSETMEPESKRPRVEE